MLGITPQVQQPVSAECSSRGKKLKFLRLLTFLCRHELPSFGLILPCLAFLSLYLSVCSVCRTLCLCFCLSLSLYLSVSLSVCLSLSISVCLAVSLSLSVFPSLSISLFHHSSVAFSLLSASSFFPSLGLVSLSLILPARLHGC